MTDDHEKLTHEKQVELAQEFKKEGKTNSEIAHILQLPESIVRGWVEIDWSQNCLTKGVHNGNDGSIWNIPLGFAISIFDAHTLRDLVIERIYNDAMQFVEYGQGFDMDWAAAVKKYAEEKYQVQLQHKVGELSNYYKAANWRSDQVLAVRLVKRNKLNKGYEPLHSHDSINLLCRIIGTSAVLYVARPKEESHE